jgi:RimJ/RimL family protein N-acetyltransferase
VAADDDRRLLGSISIMRLAWEHARGEVGYWLAEEARGQGHATRATRAICRWAFEALKLERIDLLAATGNPASQRVAERCGFTREAVLRSYMRGRDGPQDMVAYGLLLTDPTDRHPQSRATPTAAPPPELPHPDR